MTAASDSQNCQNFGITDYLMLQLWMVFAKQNFPKPNLRSEPSPNLEGLTSYSCPYFKVCYSPNSK